MSQQEPHHTIGFKQGNALNAKADMMREAMLGTAMLTLLTEHCPSLTCSLAPVVQVAQSLTGFAQKRYEEAVVTVQSLSGMPYFCCLTVRLQLRRVLWRLVGQFEYLAALTDSFAGGFKSPMAEALAERQLLMRVSGRRVLPAAWP